MSHDAPPTGHVKLARKAFSVEYGDPFWLEDREFSRWEAWVDVIQLAAWREHTLSTEQFGAIELARGEFVASLRWLATRWGWTIKRVRTWLATCEKGARLRAQRETQAGTVYLLVKYDTYQSIGHSEGTAEGTPKGAARAQRGHKTEAVLHKPTTSSALDALPEATVSAAYDRWVAVLGTVNYGLLRKVLSPVFIASPRRYSGEQLANAVDAFADARNADAPQWRGKWTVQKFAAELHEWVRLGAMELVDEWGMPTERGRAARVMTEQ